MSHNSNNSNDNSSIIISSSSSSNNNNNNNNNSNNTIHSLDRSVSPCGRVARTPGAHGRTHARTHTHTHTHHTSERASEWATPGNCDRFHAIQCMALGLLRAAIPANKRNQTALSLNHHPLSIHSHTCRYTHGTHRTTHTYNKYAVVSANMVPRVMAATGFLSSPLRLEPAMIPVNPGNTAAKAVWKVAVVLDGTGRLDMSVSEL